MEDYVFSNIIFEKHIIILSFYKINNKDKIFDVGLIFDPFITINDFKDHSIIKDFWKYFLQNCTSNNSISIKINNEYLIITEENNLSNEYKISLSNLNKDEINIKILDHYL